MFTRLCTMPTMPVHELFLPADPYFLSGGSITLYLQESRTRRIAQLTEWELSLYGNNPQVFFAQSIVVLFGVTTNMIYSEFFCLWEMYKDTNCQSELKPVFIYTRIHMVTSCSNVQICIFFNKENTVLLHLVQLHIPTQT